MKEREASMFAIEILKQWSEEIYESIESMAYLHKLKSTRPTPAGRPEPNSVKMGSCFVELLGKCEIFSCNDSRITSTAFKCTTTLYSYMRSRQFYM